jgi:hypothetical protein
MFQQLNISLKAQNIRMKNYATFFVDVRYGEKYNPISAIYNILLSI